MAMSSVLRRASSSVLPIAIRAVGSQRSFHGTISAARSVRRTSLGTMVARHSLVPFIQFSTVFADQRLLDVLEAEIKCGEEIEGPNTFDEIPNGFPFEIQDNSGERTISLMRKSGDETIKVEVDMLSFCVEDEDDDDGDADADADADNQESINNSGMPLVISISKGNGLQLEFGITASSEEFTIDSLSIKKSEGSEEQHAYEGPEFNDLDESFKNALYGYLDARGINETTTSFLHKYMIAKEGKEYITWLKNLKKFVEH